KIIQANNHLLVGRRMDNINIYDLEKRLRSNPFIEFAKVYADMDGVINVEISQRQPVLRIINRYDQDFYVDQHGLKIPLSANFTARVLAANGYIDELFANRVDTLQTPLAMELFKAANYIRNDSLWDAQIAEIYVNKDREIELIPRVGNNRILLGNADSLETKFRNLLVFYKKALPQVGWDAYKTINIKYANQVVGVRNEILKTDSLKPKAGTDTTKAIKDTSQLRINMDKSSTLEKSSPIVVGLDIGTTKICVIVGRRSKNGKIEVLGIGKAESAGVTRGMVSNIDKTVQGITQAVDIAGAQSNVEIKVVNVGIAGQHIKSLQHRGLITRRDVQTEISRKDIDKLVEDMYNLVMPPGEEIIHVLPQEFTVDNEPGIKDPIGMAGVRLEANFHIISGQVTAIKN